jgi:hypothetical protein
MKQCVNPEVGIMLTGYQLGILNADEAQRFDAHLKECECCRLELKQSNTAMSMLRKRRVDVLQALHSEGIDFNSAKDKLLASYQPKNSKQEDQSSAKGFFKNLFKKNLSISNHNSNGTLALNWKWALAPVSAIVLFLVVSMVLFSHKTIAPDIVSSSGNQIANQSNHSGNPSQPSDNIINKVFSFFKLTTSATLDSNNYSPTNEIQMPGGSEPSFTGNTSTPLTPSNLSTNSVQNPTPNNLQRRNPAQTNSLTADSDYANHHQGRGKSYVSSNSTPSDSSEINKPGNRIAAAIASRMGDVSDIAQKIKRFLSERSDFNKDTAK